MSWEGLKGIFSTVCSGLYSCLTGAMSRNLGFCCGDGTEGIEQISLRWMEYFMEETGSSRKKR